MGLIYSIACVGSVSELLIPWSQVRIPQGPPRFESVREPFCSQKEALVRFTIRSARGYLFASISIAAAVPLLSAFPSLNLTSDALAFVVAVMLVAIQWGSGPALWGAIESMLLFNFFFIPPVHTFTISGTENWVALLAFVITALLVGQLSSRERKRARQAEEQKNEIERLYRELERTYREANEAELLRRSEKLKTALLDAVTHDLRTPLTSIKASATTLLSELSPDGGASLDRESRQELLEVINEESDRLNRFVEEMMELALIEAGRLSLQCGAATIHDIANAALDRAQNVLKDHRVEVTLQDGLPTLHVDAAALAEVFFSLLDNAAKFSPAGTLIHVSAEKMGGDDIEFAVEDEGIGVPVEMRDRVFEKFFRAAPSRERRSGFGMGLAIAKGIVEAHGGKLRVANGSNGRGSRFAFTLPGSAMAQSA